MTNIQWTGETLNPTTGCDRISPGCLNCYALSMAKRLKGMGQAKYQNDGDPRTSGPGFALTMHPDTLNVPLTWKKPRLIFVNSMSDLFHAKVTDEFIARFWAVMALTPQHTYQILTKRHGRMRSLLNSADFVAEVRHQVDILRVRQAIKSMGPERVVPAPGFPDYLVSDRGHVYSTRGSDSCVWCQGELPESSEARRRYCSSTCRTKAAYEKQQGRWSEPTQTMRRMTPQPGEWGHERVMLYKDGTSHRVLIHRLVLEAFARTPLADEQGCHLDGDPSNNALPNLRWGTHSSNWDDRKRHGNGRSYTKLSPEQVDQIRSRAELGESAAALGRAYGVSDTQIRNIIKRRHWPEAWSDDFQWPLPGVHLGVSVEDQKWADIRIPALMQTPAAIRFLSLEPLLGPVRLHRGHAHCPTHDSAGGFCSSPCPDLILPNWMIIGGESGPGARPFNPQWAADLINDARQAGAAPFVKQLGSVWARDTTYAGKTVAAHGDTKGGKPQYWPAHLRVREYPQQATADA